MNTEPVLMFLAGLAGTVAMGLAVATGFGWVEATQAAAIVAFVTAVTGILVPFLRSRVSPV